MYLGVVIVQATTKSTRDMHFPASSHPVKYSSSAIFQLRTIPWHHHEK